MCNLLMAVNLKYFTMTDGGQFVVIIFGTITTELIFSANNSTKVIFLVLSTKVILLNTIWIQMPYRLEDVGMEIVG